MIRRSIGILLASITINPIHHYAYGYLPSLFLPKSQGFYEIHYRRPHDDGKERCEQPAFVSLTLNYQHTRAPNEIASALFGSPVLEFAGSEITTRTSTQLVADYFGLPPDFQGAIRLSPHIQNTTFDLFYHLNLKSLCDSFFIEIGAPLVYSVWHLNGCERVTQQGMLVFPPCDFAPPQTVARTATSIQQALGGSFLTGDLQVPWHAGKFVFEPQHTARLADISVALGVDLMRNDRCNLTFSVLTIMPTGNKYNSRTVFSPLAGNGDHWELGCALAGRWYHAWSPCHDLELYVLGVFTHLFESQQFRTFDLRGHGPLSRYLPLKEYIYDSTNNAFTYNSVVMNAVNFATRYVAVSCPAQGDLTFQLTHRRPHAVLSLGYNFFGRAAEEVALIPAHVPCELLSKFYAIKGTQGTCYRLYEGDPVSAELPAQALNNSQQSTITTPGPLDNPFVVIPQSPATVALSWNSNSNNQLVLGQTVASIISAPDYFPATTSQPLYLLNRQDLDLDTGAAPKSRVHTLFGTIGARWNSECREPTITFGGALMWGTYGAHAALQNWSAWIQFYIRF